jgi:uncharacterized protein YvpB
VVRRERARIEYRLAAARTAQRVLQASRGGGRATAVGKPVAAAVRAPVFQQAQRNSCESAALAILLATTGQVVDQTQLQNELPRSGTLDPIDRNGERVWGDPELGYVGRPDGGGVAGGFGVYQAPVAKVAARHGRRLEVVSGAPSDRVYDRLLEGRAVMVWVGLSDGPYGEWTSPEGKPVRVNFGEHTVVLQGIRRDGSLIVSNPLEGTREAWTRGQFEVMWERLGRRALMA